jgi:hypothetical protein
LLPTAAAIVMSVFLEHPPPSLHAAMNFTPTQRNAINHTPAASSYSCAPAPARRKSLARRMATPTTRTNIPNQISDNWALS